MEEAEEGFRALLGQLGASDRDTVKQLRCVCGVCAACVLCVCCVCCVCCACAVCVCCVCCVCCVSLSHGSLSH